MAGYVGAKMQIALKKESVRGTAATPDAGSWLAHKGFTFGPVVTKVEDDSGIGSIIGVNKACVTEEMSSGAIPMVLQRHNLGDLGNLIMGQAPSTTGSGTYTHDWVLYDANSHVTYTVCVDDPVAGGKSYARCLMNTLTMELVPSNGFVMSTIELQGGKEGSASYTSSYPSSEDYFCVKNAKVYIATNYAGLSGASELVLKSLNLTVTKNVLRDEKVGSSEENDYHNQRLDIRGDMTFKYDADTYRSLGLGTSNRAVKIDLIDDTYHFTITLPSVHFQDWSKESDNSAIMANTVGFIGNYEDRTNGLVKVQVIDDVATH